MRKSINNKGSALVTVIVALAIVGVLAVVALWISLINFQMKTTDKDVKDNFYSAESVLDEICVGLQQDVSEAYNIAYTDVMQSYSSLAEDERSERFGKEFVYYFRDRVKSLENGGSELRYSMDKLLGYVDPNVLDHSTYPYADVTSITAEEGFKDGLLNVYESGISLKGIRVSYTDEKGYNSIIETDIKISIPQMNFHTSEEMPDTFSFSIIGNKGIEFATGMDTVYGSVYAGSAYELEHSSNNLTSLQIDKGSYVDFINGKYVIADGILDIDTSKVSVDAQNQVWAENILVDSSYLKLAGNTYVSDDLTLKGSGPQVVLGDNGMGKYVGYGDDDSVAGNSSAIIINGKDSSLNMSNLDELFVAGYSFIQTSAIDSDLVPNDDVRMGESISLKGNQIAYLVPSECIGVDGYGESVYGRNPITYSEYLKIYNSGTYDFVNDSVVSSKTGHPLSYYLDEGEKIDDCVTTVFVPAASGVQDDILVYLYLSLSKENAQRYYNDYYEQCNEKLETYTKFFADVIQSSDQTSRVYTAGNYSLYENEKLSLASGSEENVASEITQVDHTYRALSSTLTTNYEKYVAGELDRTVFDNLIDIDKFNSVTAVSKKKVVSYTPEDGDEITAVICDNQNGAAYTYNTEGQEGGKLRLIVASGDVDINGNYTGTVIARGKITVKGSQTIKNEDIENMKKLLSTEIDAGSGVYVYDIFRNGSSYLVSSLVGGETPSVEDSQISYKDIITYENWIKK